MSEKTDVVLVKAIDAMLAKTEMIDAMAYGVEVDDREDFLVAIAQAAIDAALTEVADEIVRELICCDAYDGKGSDGKHDICYWSGAARALVLRHTSGGFKPASSPR